MIKFSEDFIAPIFEDQNPAIFLFTDQNDTDYLAAYAEVSKIHQGDILFMTLGWSEDVEHKLGEMLNIDYDMFPCIRILAPDED